MHLIGYCEQPPALVFPYMERLSLFHSLHQTEVSSTIRKLVLNIDHNNNKSIQDEEVS